MDELINGLISGQEGSAVPSKVKPRNAASLRRAITELAAKENALVPAERQVTRHDLETVAARSLTATAGMKRETRFFVAYREVASFVALAVHGKIPNHAAKHRDLLPVGHPISTKSHAMTASAYNTATARWVAADPRVDDSVREIVAAAYQYPHGSVEQVHASTRLVALTAGLVPQDLIIESQLVPITAAGDPFAGGNSSIARSARARKQRKDRKMQFAEQGGGMQFFVKNSAGKIASVIGRFSGNSADKENFEIEVTGDPNLPDGIYSVPANRTEALSSMGAEAMLPSDVVADKLGKSVALPEGVEAEDVNTIEKVDSPAGWTLVKERQEGEDGPDKVFESADGYRVDWYAPGRDKAELNVALNAAKKKEMKFDGVGAEGVGVTTIDPKGQRNLFINKHAWDFDQPFMIMSRQPTDDSKEQSIGITQSWSDTQTIASADEDKWDAFREKTAKMKAADEERIAKGKAAADAKAKADAEKAKQPVEETPAPAAPAEPTDAEKRSALKDLISSYDEDGTVGKMIDDGATPDEISAELSKNPTWAAALDDLEYSWAVDLPQKMQKDAWAKTKKIQDSIKGLGKAEPEAEAPVAKIAGNRRSEIVKRIEEIDAAQAADDAKSARGEMLPINGASYFRDQERAKLYAELWSLEGEDAFPGGTVPDGAGVPNDGKPTKKKASGLKIGDYFTTGELIAAVFTRKGRMHVLVKAISLGLDNGRIKSYELPGDLDVETVPAPSEETLTRLPSYSKDNSKPWPQGESDDQLIEQLNFLMTFTGQPGSPVLSPEGEQARQEAIKAVQDEIKKRMAADPDFKPDAEGPVDGMNSWYQDPETGEFLEITSSPLAIEAPVDSAAPDALPEAEAPDAEADKSKTYTLEFSGLMDEDTLEELGFEPNEDGDYDVTEEEAAKAWIETYELDGIEVVSTKDSFGGTDVELRIPDELKDKFAEVYNGGGDWAELVDIVGLDDGTATPAPATVPGDSEPAAAPSADIPTDGTETYTIEFSGLMDEETLAELGFEPNEDGDYDVSEQEAAEAWVKTYGLDGVEIVSTKPSYGGTDVELRIPDELKDQFAEVYSGGDNWVDLVDMIDLKPNETESAANPDVALVQSGLDSLGNGGTVVDVKPGAQGEKAATITVPEENRDSFEWSGLSWDELLDEGMLEDNGDGTFDLFVDTDELGAQIETESAASDLSTSTPNYRADMDMLGSPDEFAGELGFDPNEDGDYDVTPDQLISEWLKQNGLDVLGVKYTNITDQDTVDFEIPEEAKSKFAEVYRGDESLDDIIGEGIDPIEGPDETPDGGGDSGPKAPSDEGNGGGGAEAAPVVPTQAAQVAWDYPEGAYKLNTAEYDPEGRQDEESTNYTDDPKVLANKFSSDEIRDALALAIRGIKDFASQFLEDMAGEIDDESEDEEAAPKKGKPGPKKKKPKKAVEGTGFGKLEFNQGEEFVPAEALYHALVEQGVDADMLLAELYDLDSGETKNVDALNLDRKVETVGAQTPSVILDDFDDYGDDPDMAKMLELASDMSRARDVSLSVSQIERARKDGEPNQSITELADQIIDLPDTISVDQLLAKNIGWAIAGTPEQRQAFQGLWGILIAADGGLTKRDATDEDQTRFHEGVAVALQSYNGTPPTFEEVKAIFDEFGYFPDLLKGKEDIGNGEVDLYDDNSLAGAMFRLTASLTLSNETPMYRGTGADVGSDKLAYYTTKGGVISLDPRSFSDDNNVAAMFGAVFTADTDKASIVFTVPTGAGEFAKIDKISMFNEERESLGWGNYRVKNVVETVNEHGKSVYEVELEKISEREALLEGLSNDYADALIENKEFDLSPSYYSPGTDPYVPTEETDPELSEEFTDNPLSIARMWDSNSLVDAFIDSIEDGSGKVLLEFPDGFQAQVDSEAIRDALQIQGVDTNEILENIELLGDLDALDIDDEPTISNVDSPLDQILGGYTQEYDIEDFEQYGPQAGSNEGGFYEDIEGNQYYVKTPKSQLHAENEVLASALYEIAGVDSAHQRIGSGDDGEKKVFSALVPGAKSDLATQLENPEYKKKLQEGFAIDAWLANWDVAGLTFDNVVTDENGSPVRVDPGGALMFRAMGAPKGGAFGNEVTELDTLVDPDKNSKSAAVFGDMTEDEKVESARKLLDISDEDIDYIVDSIISDPEAAEQLKDTLKARRFYILDRYNLLGEDTNQIVNDSQIEEPVAEETPAVDVTPETPEVTAPEAPAANVANPYVTSDGTPITIGMKVRYKKTGEIGEVVKYDKGNTGYVHVKGPDGSIKNKSTKQLVADNGGGDEGPTTPEAPETPEIPVEPEVPTVQETPETPAVPDAATAPAPQLKKIPAKDLQPGDLIGGGEVLSVSSTSKTPAGKVDVVYRKKDGTVVKGTWWAGTIISSFGNTNDNKVDETPATVEPAEPAVDSFEAQVFIGESNGEPVAMGERSNYAVGNRVVAQGDGVVYFGTVQSVDGDGAWIEFDDNPVNDDKAGSKATVPNTNLQLVSDAIAVGMFDQQAAIDWASAGNVPQIETIENPFTTPELRKAAEDLIKIFPEGMGPNAEFISLDESDGRVAFTLDGETIYMHLPINGLVESSYPMELAKQQAADGEAGWREFTQEELDYMIQEIQKFSNGATPEELPEPEQPTAEDIEEPEEDEADVLTPPPGAVTTTNASGQLIWKGLEVADKTGNVGVAQAINKDGYVQVVFDDGSKAMRSPKTLTPTGNVKANGTVTQSTAKPKAGKITPAGAPIVVVDQPADWSTSDFADVPSFTAAIDAVKSEDRKAAGMAGASAAVDSDSIEDLDVRIMRVRDKNGNDGIRLKFKLTAWAGNAKAKTLLALDKQQLNGTGGTREYGVNLDKIEIGEDGIGQITEESSGTNLYSGSGYTWTLRTEDGIVIKFYRANPTATSTISSGGPKAFHNLVEIQAPANATPEQIAKAINLAGVYDTRPATQADARVLVENRLMSIFDAQTDATKNPKGDARAESLARIEAKYGITPDNVVLTTGASGRIETRLDEAGAQKIVDATGKPAAILHNVTVPYKFSDTDEEKKEKEAQYIANLLATPQGGLLSTSTRWTEGIGGTGMSSHQDVNTGGADYVFTKPVLNADAKVYGTGSIVMYFDPVKVYQRIDFYANYSDKYGKRVANQDILKAAKTGAYEVMFKHRLSYDDLDSVIVRDQAMRTRIIAILRQRGIDEIGGRPLEAVILVGSKVNV